MEMIAAPKVWNEEGYTDYIGCRERDLGVEFSTHTSILYLSVGLLMDARV